MEFKPDGVRLVKELADANAVLFLWVTSPLLERCFSIIKAWGFNYKASFVWDKIKHVMGHYNSVRHELLLVCTRGSCKPDVPKLIDSVQCIERSDKHSEKPQQFYEIIEGLYDHGRKLELFSRSPREGWDAAGNERRALLKLANAGLIEVEYHQQRSPRVTILSPYAKDKARAPASPCSHEVAA
jgi:N6-adenosine-specific RNA methylase IME4